MFSLPRRIKILIVFVVVVVGGYAVASLFGSSANGVPAEFREARLQGAVIAQNIVNLSNQSVRDLERINQLDRGKKFAEAIDLTTQAVLQSRDIREQAVALSAEIEKMTRSLSGVKSLKARQAALEAITNHLALISRLIGYSASMSQLLETLRDRFTGIPGEHRVAGLITQINVEIAAINSFNNQSVQALEQFDKLTQ